MAEVFDYPFVPVHRDLLDHALLRLSGNGVKALLVVMRKTVGWADPNDSSKRKMQDDISFSQFRKAMGGSNATIQEALDEVVKAGYVIHIDRGPRRVHAYRLNLAFNTNSDGGIAPKQPPQAQEHACRWCGRQFSANGLKAHEWRCREKPGETVTETVKDASVTETVTDGAGKSVTGTVIATVTETVKENGESVTESVNTKERSKERERKERETEIEKPAVLENDAIPAKADAPCGASLSIQSDAGIFPESKPEKPPPKKKQPGSRKKQGGGMPKDAPPAAWMFYYATQTVGKGGEARGGRCPPGATWKAMDEVVGRKQADLQFWKQVVEKYMLVYANPQNIDAMLDHFKRRELPSTAPGKSGGRGGGCRPGQISNDEDILRQAETEMEVSP